MIKILHTADIHLGREFSFLREKGNEYRNQLLATFENIVDLAISESVSLLLIAGDLFDTNRVHGIVIRRVLSAFKKLESKGIHVCIIPGTHDIYDEDSVYRFVKFPSNVTVFTPEFDREVYKDLDLTVYGEVFDGKYVDESPIQRLSLSKDSKYHIGMAHCSVKIEGWIEKDALLLGRDGIANSGLDYLALGHWHSFQDFSQGDTKAFYCGAPEPVSMDQKGAGNVIMITIREKGDITVDPIRVGTRQFAKLSVDVGVAKSMDDIVPLIEAKSDPNLILELTLGGLCSMDYDLYPRDIEEELGDRFFCLRVVDKSHPKLEEVSLKNIPEETVEGKFIKIMQEIIESADNEEDRGLYEEALKLGFACLQGRTQVLE